MTDAPGPTPRPASSAAAGALVDDAEATSAALGLLARSPFLRRARHLPVERRLAPERTVAHRFAGREHRVALPVTFTPFASSRPCSARCRFCSETLVHEDATALSAGLRPGPRYAEVLAGAFAELRGLPVGLSLSGLESTDDPAWLPMVLDAAERHRAEGGVIDESVLYSNGNGLAHDEHGPALLARLAAFGLDRLELSRHDPDAARNHHIMRFRGAGGSGAASSTAEGFAPAVRRARALVPVRLVCVLQRAPLPAARGGGEVDGGPAAGVFDRAGVERMLAFALDLGITDVVFRELSRLGPEYVANATRRYVDAARVPLEAVLDELWPEGGAPTADLEPRRLTAGYYFWNLRCRWRGEVDVTFETSDYAEMKARHHSSVVHKLVLHANNNLCADWDPGTRVLWRGEAGPPLARRPLTIVAASTSRRAAKEACPC